MSTVKQIKEEIHNIANIYERSAAIASDYVKADCDLEDIYRDKILDCLARESSIIHKDILYKQEKQKYCITMGSPKDVINNRSLFHTFKSLVHEMFFNFSYSYILEDNKYGWMDLVLQPGKTRHYPVVGEGLQLYRILNTNHCYSRYSHPYDSKRICFINMCYASLWSEPLL